MWRLLGTKTSYHRHKGVSIGWINSFWLSKLLCFGWVKWDSVKTGRCEQRWVGTPGRRCRCGGRRRREAPTTAGAAATAARRTPRQTLKFVLRAITKQNQNTQKKMPTTQPNPQYSAKNNVTIHMIYTFMPPPLQQTTMLYCYMKITK